MDILMVLPTIVFVGLFTAIFVWVGRHHRRTWGDARGQESSELHPIRESTVARGAGGLG